MSTQDNVTLYIDDDVHIFTFKNSSRNACKEYIALVSENLPGWIEKYDRRPFLVILDVSESGLFSISFVKELTLRMFDSLPFVPTLRIAYVTDSPQDIMVINTLNPATVNILNNTRQVFSPDDMDAAIAWLRGAPTG